VAAARHDLPRVIGMRLQGQHRRIAGGVLGADGQHRHRQPALRALAFWRMVSGIARYQAKPARSAPGRRRRCRYRRPPHRAGTTSDRT
jgi:hypothetical protein